MWPGATRQIISVEDGRKQKRYHGWRLHGDETFPGRLSADAASKGSNDLNITVMRFACPTIFYPASSLLKII